MTTPDVVMIALADDTTNEIRRMIPDWTEQQYAAFRQNCLNRMLKTMTEWENNHAAGKDAG